MRAVTDSRADHLPIGELSRRTGVNIETIRYYERIRMLTAPPRTASGRRVYGAQDVRILAFIRRARELGFPLEDIRTLLGLGAPGQASCGEVRDIATRHLGTSARGSAICADLNGCWRTPLLDARAPRRRSVPCWKFSISGAHSIKVCDPSPPQQSRLMRTRQRAEK
jgi:DNA-binding transcriptional MerR regulator